MSRLISEWKDGSGVPIRVWARSISQDTRKQLQRIAEQPFVVEHVAAMADAHVSEGVAVGTVFATERTVVPRALGGDLGCGMSATRLTVDDRAFETDVLKRVIALLGRAIPAGDAIHHGKGIDVPDALFADPLSTHALDHTRDALARRHLGTLGGGNHFVELDRDAEGSMWLLVHSGSRGLGAAIAAHHLRVAGEAGDSALRGLATDAIEGAAYVRDLTWALAFARANREALAKRAVDLLSDVLGQAIACDPCIDVPHNFVARERWLGRDLWIHRKGAVAAARGALALVPGSMGTASYIVEGLGNEASFGSCSHGAGRVMSRKEARAAITPRALERSLRRVVYPEHLVRHLVEEAPAAYRDVRAVLEDQEDLVVRKVRLEPVAVLKG